MNEESKEIFRQLFHMVAGLSIVILYAYDLLKPLHLFLLILLALLLSYLSLKMRIPFLTWFLEKFERKEDLKTFPGRGPIMMLIGSLLSMKLFEKNIALASISILAVGDSVSHLSGMLLGKSRNPFNGSKRKFLEGTLAGIAAGFFSALPFISWDAALVASITAMIGEAIDIDMNGRPVNDNLAVPLIAGTFAMLYSNGTLLNLFRF